MSNDYQLHCLDCDDDMPGERFNKAAGQLIAVIRHADAVRDLISSWATVCVYGEEMDGEWLNKHKDHRVVVMSEYKDHYFKADDTRVELETG